MDYKTTAEAILREVGGASNVAAATHCATRLRLTLKSEEGIDDTAVKAIDGVINVAHGGGQYQVIIGTEVPKVFAEVQPLLGAVAAGAGEAPAERKRGLDAVFDFISGVFTPILPAIIGAGLIKSILAIAQLLGADTASSTYLFVNVIGDAPLYFLPVMLAFTASKKLGCNQFLAVVIAGALIHPSYTALITDQFNIHFSSFFGIPVTLATYSSTVIPALLMVGLLYFVERACDRWIPKLMRFFFKPVVCMLVVGVVTFIVLGPLGFIVGTGICTALNALSQYVPWLVPTILGAVYPLMVTTGMHYGVVPFMMQSLAQQGFEQICCAGNLPSNIAQGAAALAVGLRTKSTRLKETAIPAGVTAILGTTEPALFGVTLQYKKVLACVMAGGCVGGFYGGIMGVKCYAFISPGLLSMAAFVGPDGWMNFIHACVSAVIGFVVTFALVWLWGARDLDAPADEKDVEPAASAGPAAPSAAPAATAGPTELLAPLAGTVVPISEVSDETFASGALGDGVGIVPVSGELVAPADATVTMVFETGHAVGLALDGGCELLIHIGIDTMKLGGRGFAPHVAAGQRVHAGEPLVSFDVDVVREAGLDPVTCLILTDGTWKIDEAELGQLSSGAHLMTVRKDG